MNIFSKILVLSILLIPIIGQAKNELCYNGKVVKHYQENRNRFTAKLNLQRLLTKKYSMFVDNKTIQMKNVKFCIDKKDKNIIHANIDNRDFKFRLDDLNIKSNKSKAAAIPIVGRLVTGLFDTKEVRFAEFVPFSVNKDGEVAAMSFQILDSTKPSRTGYEVMSGKYQKHIYYEGVVTAPSRISSKDQEQVKTCSIIGLWSDINQDDSLKLNKDIKAYLEESVINMRKEKGSLDKYNCKKFAANTLSAMSQIYLGKLLLGQEKMQIQSIDEGHLKACSYRALFDESYDLSHIMPGTKKPYLNKKTQKWIGLNMQALRGNKRLEKDLNCDKIRKNNPSLLSISMLKVIEEVELQNEDGQIHHLTCAQFETLKNQGHLDYTCSLAKLDKHKDLLKEILLGFGKKEKFNEIYNKIHLRIIGLRSTLKNLDLLHCPIVSKEMQKEIVYTLLKKESCPNYKSTNKKVDFGCAKTNLDNISIHDLHDTPWKYLAKTISSKSFQEKDTLIKHNEVIDNILNACGKTSDNTFWNHFWVLEKRCLDNSISQSITKSCYSKLYKTCNLETPKEKVKCLRKEIATYKFGGEFCIDARQIKSGSYKYKWGIMSFL